MIGLTDKKLSTGLYPDILKENIHFLFNCQCPRVSLLKSSWTEAVPSRGGLFTGASGLQNIHCS